MINPLLVHLSKCGSNWRRYAGKESSNYVISFDSFLVDLLVLWLSTALPARHTTIERMAWKIRSSLLLSDKWCKAWFLDDYSRKRADKILLINKHKHRVSSSNTNARIRFSRHRSSMIYNRWWTQKSTRKAILRLGICVQMILHHSPYLLFKTISLTGECVQIKFWNEISLKLMPWMLSNRNHFDLFWSFIGQYVRFRIHLY